MNYPDLINGLFGALGGLMNWTNVHRLYKDKQVRGWNIWSSVFFTAWGYWNCFYYPNLNQWWSFFGGLFIVTANTVWIILAFYYVSKEKRMKNARTESK